MEYETDFINCTIQAAPLRWSERSACGDLPLSIILLAAAAGGWGILLLVSGIRRTRHAWSRTKNTVVAKKMQHFQTWAYSFFHSMSYLTMMFSLGSLFAGGEYISAISLIVLEFMTVAFTSQIDVLGSPRKKPGINDIDGSIMGQYLLTTYLPKVVWKTSGHMEYVEGEEGENESKLSQICCMRDVNNPVTPKVYDVKDVVGMQGAFVGLPSLFVYLLTIVRSNGADSTETVVGASDIEFVFDTFKFNGLISLAAIMAFFSAILPPILGDWETYKKSVAYSTGSVFLRAGEVVARLGFYVYFIDFSTFMGFLMMGAEFFFMYITNITAKETSAGGRTGTLSHYLLSSWESVFFTNYRRISVDKEFGTQSTLLPAIIEFGRFLERTTMTAIGYIVMLAGDLPTSYTQSVRDMSSLPVLFYAGIAANVGVIIFNVVNFLVVNRSSMKRSDLSALWSYWKTLPPLSWLFPAAAYHVNRDHNIGEAPELF